MSDRDKEYIGTYTCRLDQVYDRENVVIVSYNVPSFPSFHRLTPREMDEITFAVTLPLLRITSSYGWSEREAMATLIAANWQKFVRKPLNLDVRHCSPIDVDSITTDYRCFVNWFSLTAEGLTFNFKLDQATIIPKYPVGT